MPFTGSHPAAILPFLRSGLPPSALVIGSMSPDIPYYVPMPLSAGVTHSPLGVLTVDLPLGLLVLGGWHLLMEPLLIACAPQALRERLPPAPESVPDGVPEDVPDGGGLPAPWRPRSADAQQAALVVLAMIVGAVTHVGWDAFTHAGRWGATHIAWLAARHGPLAGYHWAQYASGLFGAAALTGWFVQWWRRTPRLPHTATHPVVQPRSVVVGVLLVLGVATVTGVVASLPWLLDGTGSDVRRAGYYALTRGTSAGLAVVVLLAVRRRSKTAR